MKILIINNFWLGGRKLKLSEKLLLNTFSILPTLFARQLAAITPKKHNVKVVDERYSNIDFDEKYDIILINFNFSSVPRAYELANIFKKRKIPVVFSGWYSSVIADEEIKYADSILVGENEKNWLDLLDDFEKGKLKPKYGPNKFDKNLKIPQTNVEIPGSSFIGAIEATRGCPYKCDFCPEANISAGGEYFTRPIDDVIEEIKKIPQKTIMFYDNSLTINTDYTKELFRKMVGLKKRFFCQGNVDALANDKELVKLSKKAGCVSWLVGFESVSQQTINNVGKKTNKIKDYKKAVENIHRNKMAVVGSFLFGFDNDKKDVFSQTLKMINELKIDAADFCILTPIPGTPIFKKLEKEGRILTCNWSLYDFSHVVFQPKHMTPEELLYGRKKMHIDYYFTSNTINRVIRNLSYGIYQFFWIFTRNVISIMYILLLFPKDKYIQKHDKKNIEIIKN